VYLLPKYVCVVLIFFLEQTATLYRCVNALKVAIVLPQDDWCQRVCWLFLRCLACLILLVCLNTLGTWCGAVCRCPRWRCRVVV
jgi:hypothetical protein